MQLTYTRMAWRRFGCVGPFGLGLLLSQAFRVALPPHEVFWLLLPGGLCCSAVRAGLATLPLGDADCPVWGPLEFWACYGGLRPVPEAFAVSPAPVIGPRQATLLSNRWRQQLRSLIDTHQLDPATILAAQMQLAGEEHRRDFYAVLTGFRAYRPLELSALWLDGDRYRPQQWLEQWIATLPSSKTGDEPSLTRLTA